jgi:hypothetical protein
VGFSPLCRSPTHHVTLLHMANEGANKDEVDRQLKVRRNVALLG